MELFLHNKISEEQTLYMVELIFRHSFFAQS